MKIHIHFKHNPRTQIYVQSYNKEAWLKIFHEGKKYVSEKNPEQTEKRFYFDSQWVKLNELSDNQVTRYTSDETLFKTFRERCLSHCNTFEKSSEAYENITEALSILARADEFVKEIIDFLPEIISIPSLSTDLQDKTIPPKNTMC